MLQINNLEKKYKNGLVALKSINLSVPEGEVMALIGPSGAGKSTFIRCINRLVEPTAGEVILDGTNICILGSRGLRSARKSIGMIFQEYALVEQLSVMENVLTGRLGYIGFWKSAWRRFHPNDIDKAVRLLERLGLKDYIDTRADRLSGGQRQRVGIARALLQNPKLLLIDEPTASLDPKTARDIMRLIVELAHEHNVAAIINIHDVTLAKAYAKRIVGLSGGEVVFDGVPQQLDDDSLTVIYGSESWSDKHQEDSPEPLHEIKE
ncbi:phosphonate ABC transporter ATP-binding protein [Halomonas sp. ML-15]|uniref:phosphonate ABC transporter ATP-binding protein n=1 Tax=Halomonas sp. ML-15 TaxID=2773305 RepID=UPI0017472F84|nr:phosphonate ABC transporter ATP-binding protein [Halomonas sp. ML-15]MBD3896464.1 phosphonate ABC transporter ATP-binding protein [Halomonas sp. ML-15]